MGRAFFVLFSAVCVLSAFARETSAFARKQTESDGKKKKAVSVVS